MVMAMEHPALLIALPLLFSFLAPMVYYASRRSVRPYTAAVLALNALLSLWLLYYVRTGHTVMEVIAGFQPPVGIFLAVGNLGAVLAALINTFALINYIAYWGEGEDSLRFSMLYILATAGATGIVITGDLFNMFVFFEITAVASYGLVAARNTGEAYEGAVKYIIMGSVGSSFLLIGIGLIYGSLKTLNFYDIAARVGDMPETTRLLAFLFLITGIGVEAELFPLNGWVPDAYQGSRRYVAAFLSFGASKAAIYAVARVIFTMMTFSRAYDLALVLGVITLLAGELAAFRQKDPRRMLAYSSIGQMGLILVALSMRSTEGLIAALFLMVGHAASKGILFIAVNGYTRGSLRDPVRGTAIVVAVLSLIGMPPFAGFWGKWHLVMAMSDMDVFLPLMLVLLATVVEALYYSRFIYRGMGSPGGVASPSYTDRVALAAFALLLMAFGLYPGLVYNAGLRAAQSLLGGDL